MVAPYTAGVPDSSDTDSTAAASPGFASFDELSQFGVSPNLATVPINFARRKVKVPEGVPALPGGQVKGPFEYEETDKLEYEQAVRYLYGKTPEAVGDLQLGMAAAGFYGKNPYFTPKAPDKETNTAWNEVLQIAMRTGKTPDEIISEGIEANGGMEEALKKHNMSGAGTLADVPLTNPDDLRMVAKEVSRKVLGRGWDEKALNAFVQTYQAQETAAKQAAQASGATYTQPASIEAAAEAEARRSNPVAAEATDWDNAAQMLIKAFDTLGGGAE